MRASRRTHRSMPAGELSRSCRTSMQTCGRPCGPGVVVDRVIGGMLAAVGLVVADDQARLQPQALEQAPRVGLVVVPQHAGVPRPGLAGQRRREAVHGDEQGHGAAAAESAQHRLDALVVRVEKGREAQAAVVLGQVLVAGDGPAVAFLAEGLLVVRRTVAVDDQPRVARQYGRGVQRVGEAPGEFARPDVPGDVLPAGQFGHAETVQGLRERPAGVVTDDQGRRPPVLLQHHERRGVVPAEQGHGGRRLGRRGVHGARSLHGGRLTRIVTPRDDVGVAGPAGSPGAKR